VDPCELHRVLLIGERDRATDDLTKAAAGGVKFTDGICSDCTHRLLVTAR